ncbi:sigma 54-interacting transcriptional regulator [Myxococcota bacterium]|nr:sigma 54-interacting transcriptional regulator [Myxococcota bacterium]MCZ7619198.1 sigma 54-interacting transcriptional regulator [Myxococcota bacterium]
MSEGATTQSTRSLGAATSVDPSIGRAADASAALRTRTVGRRREDRIIAVSALGQRAVDRAMLAARSAQPVLIIGPPGSGKSLLARAIHTWSADAGGSLEVLTTGAVPEPLQARELFGCSAGTYPALPDPFVGALERAEGGTLVVDGLETLAPSARATLIRVLTSGCFRPEGGAEERAVRARIVATSDRDLGDDLFGVAHESVHLAPLAERREDILPLAAHFLSLAAVDVGVEPVGFTAEARAALLEEAWPGNLSELRERIRQAVRLAGAGAVSAEALLLSAPSENLPSFRDAKRGFEARYVQAVLRLCDGNISQAARLARKDRKDFYDVIRRTGIDPSEFRR